MTPKFNIDRPKISDEEINKHKDFDKLVRQFKQQSIQKAKLDKSWWKSKKVRYSAVIAGVTVVCTISYFALFNNSQNQNKNDKIVTQNTKDTGNKNQESRRFINPPSSKLAIPYSSYKVNNSKGGEIAHSSSSKIKIPKNAFVDKDGKDVIGDVTIEYREFHDKGDIIASGIPMAYDSAGIKRHLESAGMFDIKGSKDGEQVFIKEGNDIKVELASNNTEDRFNQYYLDTVSRNWNYIKRDNIEKSKVLSQNSQGRTHTENKELKNPKIEQLKKDVEITLPKKIDSVKVVYTKKAEALPKAKEPAKPSQPTGKPTFYIDGSEDEFPELAAFDKVVFEVGSENTNYSKDMHSITWSDVKVTEGPQKGKNYLLTLTYRNRVEKLIVYPVLTGADFEKAQKKYQQKFSEYQSLVEKREANEKALKTEMENKQKAYYDEIARKRKELDELARKQNETMLTTSFNSMNLGDKARRIFSVASFGIYNSDCAKTTEGVAVSPIFIKTDGSKPVIPDIVYLVDHTGNLVFSYSSDLSGMKYNPGSQNSFVIFAGKKMYMCHKGSFANASAARSNKFVITEMPGEADLIDFKKALEI
jgi:hypothetical protein